MSRFRPSSHSGPPLALLPNGRHVCFEQETRSSLAVLLRVRTHLTFILLHGAGCIYASQSAQKWKSIPIEAVGGRSCTRSRLCVKSHAWEKPFLNPGASEVEVLIHADPLSKPQTCLIWQVPRCIRTSQITANLGCRYERDDAASEHSETRLSLSLILKRPRSCKMLTRVIHTISTTVVLNY